MNTTIITITIIIIAILIIKYIANYEQENFTNDEAVQNIASLYNQAKLSVTDFTSTGTSTLNTVNATNLVSNGIVNRGNTNTETLNVQNGAGINGLTSLVATKVQFSVDAGTDVNVGNNLTVGKMASLNNAVVNGNLQVNGKITVNGGIKMGPWNIVGDTNRLFIYTDDKTGGISIKPNGGMTVQAEPNTGPGPLYGYMDALTGVCQGCWPAKL